MSVCQTCGKKYSKWVTPVSARGVCGDCFEAELRQEREAESQIDLAPALVAAAPPSEGNAEVVGEEVLAPLSAMYQELVCRVYMQSRLTQILRGHSISVVLISSCLFAGIHNYAPLQSINVFVAGLILGASYQLNGKIPRLVIAHAANNIISGFALMRG
jgi:hypothetical protein